MTKRNTKGKPDSVDIHVGDQLRARRTLIGLSQEKLAVAVGLTFQQVQKYERGKNRISAGRLYQFSHILEVSIDYFYEGLATGEAALQLSSYQIKAVQLLAAKSEAQQKAFVKLLEVV